MTPGGQGGAAADSLRAVLDSVFAGPDYRWVVKRQSIGVLRRWLGALQEWLLGFQDAHPVGFRLFEAGLVVVLIAVFVHAGWVLVRTVRSSGGAGAALPAVSGVRRDQAWYRREADRLAAEGRFVEAVQADFLALVLALDASRLLRFHPSKTPAEYAEEARLERGARAEFRELVKSLYGYAFARRPCGPDEFVEWRLRAAPERYAPAH
jgi:hypothetical protein